MVQNVCELLHSVSLEMNLNLNWEGTLFAGLRDVEHAMRYWGSV